MQLCGKSARSEHIESLNHAGFIQLSASKPLALARARARSRDLEVEVEEEKKERAHTRGKSKPVDNSPLEQRQNVTPADPYKAVETMIRNRVIATDIDLEAEIIGNGFQADLAERLRNMLYDME
jgi:hypothetical protein